MTEPYPTSSYANRSLRSVVSASTRVGHLVKQAMSFFETDRMAAWRCLNDASRLLSANSDDSPVGSPGVEKPRPGGLANWQAKRTIAYIEENLGSKMDTGDLASVVALSRSYFCRAFKHSVGLPPMEYVVVRRVERAKAMISSTRDGLADIAMACGFADQAHLNRRFRDLVGMSPGRWRRSHVAVAMPVPQRGGGLHSGVGARRYGSRELSQHEFR
jgi:AraC family transcriptional regulator